jgi:simple sugar transport system ATP-binding protein
MRAAGKAIVIITHKLHEVEEISDRVAVLRRGRFVGEMPTAQTTAQEMTNMMVGRAVSLNIERAEPENPAPRLNVENLTVRDIDGVTRLDSVSFTLRSGEILGIAGISGCGQKELLESIAGLQKVESGSIKYIHPETGAAEELVGKDPSAISAMGVALSFVPEDRLGMGLVGNMDLSDNMMLRSFRRGSSFLTERSGPRSLAQKVVKELKINTPGISTPVRKLSGGNVQKVLDVLLELCDRILVLCGGRVSGVVDARKTDKREVGLMMTRVRGEGEL